ncbi:MAG: peptidoglycan recognition family protein [Candidatus Pacebacteria bacterium]|nr:peptidoglycan recognition family protein [Candidatus Paceibacterota bacterium]
MDDGELIEVFYAYQWLIRPDGTSERLLLDKDVGWQAGSWAVNCRSVALCFAGDFTSGQPTDEVLDACASLIADYIKRFPAIKLETNVVGHREVNKKTICPGNDFLGSGGWKQILIKKVQGALNL